MRDFDGTFKFSASCGDELSSLVNVNNECKQQVIQYNAIQLLE